jgi:hypothetical protein
MKLKLPILIFFLTTISSGNIFALTAQKITDEPVNVAVSVFEKDQHHITLPDAGLSQQYTEGDKKKVDGRPFFKHRPGPLDASRPRPSNEGVRQRGTIVYTEGFEPANSNGELPVGWEVKQNTASQGGLNGSGLAAPDGITWARGSEYYLFDEDWVYFVRTDEAAMGISWQIPDYNWAISPVINLPVDNLIELSFWMWYSDVDPTIFHLTIFSDNVWTTLRSWIEEPANLYDEQIVINLSSYAGKPVKLGFVYVENDGMPMAIDDILITADSESLAIWTGAESQDWHDADNWNSAVPDANDDVLIPAGLTNYPVITGAAFSKALVITENASLTIEPAGQLTVNDVLDNLAGVNGLILESDGIDPDASLIHSNDEVPATVERYISGNSLAWHQLSSPVDEQDIVSEFHESGDALFVWHEPAQVWVSVSNTTVWPTWNVANGGDVFTPGKGYLVAYEYTPEKSNPTKVFTGDLNQGGFEVDIFKQAHPDDAFTGFNLVGNPYPSAIDWDAPLGWDRSNLVTDEGYAYWVWNDDGSGNYGVYITGGTGTNGVSRYIAPMQGFWVEANATGTLGFDNQVRTHAGQMWLKDDPADVLLLYGFKRMPIPTVMSLHSYFGKETDSGGAAKMFSMLPDAPGLYTPKHDKNYSISFLTTTDEHSSVPVAFKPGVEALYTLSLKVHGNFNHILLEDRKTGFFHNLSNFPEYNFSATPGDDAHRFVLHFKVLGVNEMVDDKFHCFYHAGQLFVFNPYKHGMQIRLIDMNGRLIREQSLNQQGMHKFGLGLPQGVYLVQMISETRTTTGKILVK